MPVGFSEYGNHVYLTILWLYQSRNRLKVPKSCSNTIDSNSAPSYSTFRGSLIYELIYNWVLTPNLVLTIYHLGNYIYEGSFK